MKLNLKLIFFLLIVICSATDGFSGKKTTYRDPLNISPSFSGNFGELRSNHFHTGLDFRTQGRIGLPVFATEDGYISRIAVSPFGYGKVLYLRQTDGKTTVYGHLSAVLPAMEKFIRERQYELKQSAVDLTVPGSIFKIRKGEMIAWSGNSGGSAGPHLHFEVRDTETERPLNPWYFLTGLHDQTAPRIKALHIYPLTNGSRINGGKNKLRIDVAGSGKAFKLSGKVALNLLGEIGFGIQAEDDFDGTGMRLGIYSASLYVDDRLLFSFKMDSLAFNQGRYVNSHIDYSSFIISKTRIHRLYLQPGNKFFIYRSDANRGIVRLTDGRNHAVRIVVADVAGNTSNLEFKVSAGKPSEYRNETNAEKEVFKYDKTSDFSATGIKIEIPEGALYDDLKFDYAQVQGNGKYLSAIHKVHHPTVALHKPYSLSIKVNTVSSSLEKKLLIVKTDSKGGISPVGGEFQDKWITAHPREFGDFAVMLDTVKPLIQAVSVPGTKSQRNATKIVFRISDKLSGIKEFEGEIDGEWALFEFDAKSSTITYIPDKQRLLSGKNHKVMVTVKDEAENVAVLRSQFYF